MPGGGGGGAVVVVVDGKDGQAAPARAAPRSVPAKLLRPVLLSAVLATGFLAAALLMFFGGASSYYRLPRLAVPDALLRAPACEQRRQGEKDRQGGVAAGRWWARPPARSAWHNMTDEELLWAASFEPRAQRRPPGQPVRRPKVAFMFLTRGPLPLAPLWERFFNGTGGAEGRELFSVYVHTTPGYRHDFPPSSPFHRRQVPSKPTRWGNVNVVDAERRLLANALLDFSNERFVLVSESCIPLYPLPVVHAYLTRSRHSFVGAFDDPSPHGRGRYRAGLAPDVTLSQWRKGAQWFEMDRRLAVFVIADDRYYPRFRTECRAPCYVDEHYLPTVLSIEAPERIANRTVTLVDWSRGGAHPATFGAADVTEDFLGRLVGKKRSAERCMYNGQPVEVCFLFARKFAPAALPQLLSLSAKLILVPYVKPPAKPWRAGGGLTPAPTPTKVYRVEPREFRDLVQRLTGAPAAAMAMARQQQHLQHGQQLLQRAPTHPVPLRPGGVEGAAAVGQMYAPWCSFPLMGPPASVHPGLDGHHLM